MRKNRDVRKIRKGIPLLLLTMFFAVLLFGAVGSDRVYACSCASFETYTEALEASSHVLDATVVNKKVNNNDMDVTLSVAAVWKGEAKHQMDVITAPHSASCGYEFEVGKRYAVFANESDGALRVSLCSATTLLADDSSIFEELGQPQELSFTRTDAEGGAITSGKTSSEASKASEQEADQYDPQQIKQRVSQSELEQQLDSRKSQFMIVFAIIGGLLIVGAAALVIMSRKR